MVQISGKYEQIKSDKFFEYLVAQSVSEEVARYHSVAKTVIDVIHEGENVTIKGSVITSNFVLNKEVNEKLSKVLSLQSTAVLNGNVLTVISKSPKTVGAGKRIYTFSDSGLVITFEGETSDIPVATRYYRKL